MRNLIGEREREREGEREEREKRDRKRPPARPSHHSTSFRRRSDARLTRIRVLPSLPAAAAAKGWWGGGQCITGIRVRASCALTVTMSGHFQFDWESKSDLTMKECASVM